MTADTVENRRFTKNENLEALLVRLNSLLETAEKSIPQVTYQPHPLVVLVGAPRSGTTLAMQWLASTGAIEVPTNLLSRFYRAPAIGLMIQKLLTDPRYQYRDELTIAEHAKPAFRSDLGKTSGTLNHNSFFYFWRQFQPNLGLQPMTHHERESFDKRSLNQAILRITAEAERPFAIKGLLMQYDLDIINETIEKVVFVHVVRNPIANMSSLLRARASVCGSVDQWWCSQPPGSSETVTLSPELQVAAQVRLCNAAIKRQLAAFPAECSVEIAYENLCQNPSETFELIVCKLRHKYEHGSPKFDYRGPASFKASTTDRLDVSELRRLEKAWSFATAFGS